MLRLGFAFFLMALSATLWLSCSDRSLGTCGPGSCDGCCRNGVCHNGDLDDACGLAGQTCSDCASQDEVCTPSRSCGNDCGPSNCDGCCDDKGQCLPGGDTLSCGQGGTQCVQCDSHQRCDSTGSCRLDQPCLPLLCNGCCDADGRCHPGDQDTMCGAGTTACLDCEAVGATCSPEGVCTNSQQTCGPDNCVGCCTPDNECVVGTNASQCGAGGELCQACSDQICEDGHCAAGCVDQDQDGYGPGCALGDDCDDLAPGIFGPCQPDGCPEGWAHVPAGSFIMGCDEGDPGCIGPAALARPKHIVVLNDYCVQLTQITVAQYRACMQDNVCTATPCLEGEMVTCKYSAQPGVNDAYPVNEVSWHDARWVCQIWFGGDLPTEAQWEKAARGTDGRTWPWGDSPEPDCQLTFMAGCGAGHIVEVGQYPQSDSPYGVQDTYGLLSEWVLDAYSDTFYAGCGASCSEPYNEPVDPENGFTGVMRGFYFPPLNPGPDPIVYPGIASRNDWPVASLNDPAADGMTVRCVRSWP